MFPLPHEYLDMSVSWRKKHISWRGENCIFRTPNIRFRNCRTPNIDFARMTFETLSLCLTSHCGSCLDLHLLIAFFFFSTKVSLERRVNALVLMHMRQHGSAKRGGKKGKETLPWMQPAWIHRLAEGKSQLTFSLSDATHFTSYRGCISQFSSAQQLAPLMTQMSWAWV